MAKRLFFFRRDWLGDRLRREAMEARPAFSAAIHDRIEKVIIEEVIEGCFKGDGRPARRLAIEKVIEGCRQNTLSVADANQPQTSPSESPYRRAGRFTAVSRRIAFAMAATAGVALLVLSIYLAPRQWWSLTIDSPNIGTSQPDYLVHEGIPDPTGVANFFGNLNCECATACGALRKTWIFPKNTACPCGLANRPAASSASSAGVLGQAVAHINMPGIPATPDPTAAEAAVPPALNARLATQETQLGLLVYNDARRAARVLLNRLPVDLQAIDD
jgi:hypothetical protein